jgi:hypothetical protein
MRDEWGHDESCYKLLSPQLSLGDCAALKFNGSWPPSQSSNYLEDLRGHSLSTALDPAILQIPNYGALDPRPQEVSDNGQ